MLELRDGDEFNLRIAPYVVEKVIETVNPRRGTCGQKKRGSLLATPPRGRQRDPVKEKEKRGRFC